MLWRELYYKLIDMRNVRWSGDLNVCQGSAKYVLQIVLHMIHHLFNIPITSMKDLAFIDHRELKRFKYLFYIITMHFLPPASFLRHKHSDPSSDRADIGS